MIKNLSNLGIKEKKFFIRGRRFLGVFSKLYLMTGTYFRMLEDACPQLKPYNINCLFENRAKTPSI